VIWREGGRAANAWARRNWLLVVLLLVIATLATATHERGHVWGDDFALYLRQAKGLVDGNVGQVIADNHFNVDNAARPTFSPYVYPWGFPVLLAPFVRLWGLDYDKLKLVDVACMVGFLACFHQLVRRRTPKWTALAVVATIGSTLYYLQHTDLVQSEYPYMFAAAGTLLLLDRLRRDGPLHHAPRNGLIALGLMAMLVFNIRREGLAMEAAIVAAQLSDLRGNWRGADRWRMAAPHITFVTSVALVQFMLPSALAPDYRGSGLGQTWRKLQGPFRRTFAEQLGFAHLRGLLLLAVFLLCVAGLVVRMTRAPRSDLPLAVFAILSMVLVGMIPAQADRYLMAVTPYALYFAVQGVRAIPLPKDAATWLAVGGLAVVTIAHATDLPRPIRDARRFDDSGQVVDGPAAPYVQPAWNAVRTYTHQDDVVAFFKVRALTLYTNRRGVQSTPLDVVQQRADYYLMLRDLKTGQPQITDSQASAMGWTKMWSDSSWVLWRVRQAAG
jgi:hypothetical protein